MYVIGTICYDECLYCPMWYLEDIDIEASFNRHVLGIFETGDLKEVHILYFISAITLNY